MVSIDDTVVTAQVLEERLGDGEREVQPSDAMDDEDWLGLRARRIWCIDFEPAPDSEPERKRPR